MVLVSAVQGYEPGILGKREVSALAPPSPSLGVAPPSLGPGPFDVRLTPGEGLPALVLPALVPSLDGDGEWVSGLKWI